MQHSTTRTICTDDSRVDGHVGYTACSEDSVFQMALSSDTAIRTVELHAHLGSLDMIDSFPANVPKLVMYSD